MLNMQKSGKYPIPEAVRVGGGSICAVCELPYYDHPCHVPYFDLTCLCDGRIVKL
jgi:hypothetical protein